MRVPDDYMYALVRVPNDYMHAMVRVRFADSLLNLRVIHSTLLISPGVPQQTESAVSGSKFGLA